MTEKPQAHFGYHIAGAGAHTSAWRAPYADPLGVLNPEQWINIARIAERGTLDALFIGDVPSVVGGPESLTAGPGFSTFDPMIVLSLLASNTERIGLVPTVSASFEEPFHLARRIATLDHFTGGRAGWNLVTTQDPQAAENFGTAPLPPREIRYARAQEFLDVVLALWDSWDEDAVVADQGEGVYVAPGRVSAIDHSGEHFSVRGPLTLPRSPQGRPVVFQAGGSAAGMDLAARDAEAVFTSAPSLESARRVYADLKRRVVAQGRDPGSVKVLPGLVTVIGSSDREAQERFADLEHISGEEAGLTSGIGMVAFMLGTDPGELDANSELPYAQLETWRESFRGSLGLFDAIVELGRSEQLTVRQIAERFPGQYRVIGSPERVADHIEKWLLNGAADGFTIMADVNPSGLETFVDHVVPILRSRGLFRHEYAGTTLRDHLGLVESPSSHRRRT